MRAAILGIVGAIGLAASGAALAEQGEDLGFSDAQTARAVETFNSGADGCEAAPVEYRADCFQQVFGQKNTHHLTTVVTNNWKTGVSRFDYSGEDLIKRRIVFHHLHVGSRNHNVAYSKFRNLQHAFDH